MNENQLIEIMECAKDIFCNGIYVPCDVHPCGWDFISFENIEDNNIEYVFENEDISDGIYDGSHDYDGLNLEEVLEKTKGKFQFERSSIDF